MYSPYACLCSSLNTRMLIRSFNARTKFLASQLVPLPCSLHHVHLPARPVRSLSPFLWYVRKSFQMTVRMRSSCLLFDSDSRQCRARHLFVNWCFCINLVHISIYVFCHCSLLHQSQGRRRGIRRDEHPWLHQLAQELHHECWSSTGREQ